MTLPTSFSDVAAWKIAALSDGKVYPPKGQEVARLHTTFKGLCFLMNVGCIKPLL